jgi:hypothetical protein
MRKHSKFHSDGDDDQFGGSAWGDSASDYANSFVSTSNDATLTSAGTDTSAKILPNGGDTDQFYSVFTQTAPEYGAPVALTGSAFETTTNSLAAGISATDVQSMESGEQWSISMITYSFPTVASLYGANYQAGENLNGLERFRQQSNSSKN